MDAKGWDVPDDVYNAFLGWWWAPSWHGRNFNALRDSVAVGRVNQIDVPYLIQIRDYAAVRTSAVAMARDFVGLIKQLHVGMPSGH